MEIGRPVSICSISGSIDSQNLSGVIEDTQISGVLY